MAVVIRYRCKCQDCKHEWTSHKDTGPSKYCPQCRSRMIEQRPLQSTK